jgi:hypothetical protein
MEPRPITKIYYGPSEHQFFWCDAGALDEQPDMYASSPAEWRRRNPDMPPAFSSLDHLADYDIVPGTH